MDLMRAIQYPFEDEDWTTKVGLGALIAIVPILNFAALGYTAEITRRVANGDPRPLPAWDDLSNHFMRGLYLFIGSLVHFFIPALLLCIAATPLYILPLLGGENEDLVGAFSGVTAIGTVCIGLVWIVLSFAISLVWLPGLMRFSVGRQELSELFDVRTNIDFLRAHFSTILTVILYLFVVGLVIGSVGACINFALSVIPCIGPLISVVVLAGISFYIYLMSGHLYGQAARETGLVAASPVTPAV